MKFEQDDIFPITNAIIKGLTPLLKQREKVSDDLWISKAEAAKILGATIRWLENNAEKLGVPKYKIGGLVRFKKSELIQWANKQKVPEL